MPNYIGQIVDAFNEENYEGKDGVHQKLYEWMLILCAGVAATFLRTAIFGFTGE